MDLTRLLAPRSVAVVGATDRAGAYGRLSLENLLRAGFPGRLVAVNPGRRTVLGVPCAPSLPEALDGTPVDAVVVATPAPTVPGVLADAAAAGCGGAVVFAAGFAEVGDHAAQDALRAAAGPLPVVGPNGNGVVCVPSAAPLWGDSVTLPDPAAATTALVTQSGNVGVVALAHRAGLGLHTVVSLGNAAVVDAPAAVEHLATAGPRVLAAYLEADGDGVRLARALARCAEHDVRVVLLKAGRSAAGRAVGGAHTASLSGDHAVFASLAREAGAVLVDTVHDLLETARALAAGRRDPRGCAVLSSSGGDAAVAADLAADAGVRLTAWAPPTLDALAAALPPSVPPTNPLDHTNLVWNDRPALLRIGAAVAADPDVGHALYVQDAPPGLPEADAREWRTTREGGLDGLATGGLVPLLVATTPGQEPDGAVGGLGPALRAVAALSRPAPDPARLHEIARAAAAVAGRPATGRWLAAHEGLALLGAAGVPVPAWAVAGDPDEAAEAAARLGGPCALKLSAPDLLHASDLGAVLLDVEGPDAARQAATRLLALPAGTGGRRVLLTRMAPPGVEVLVAATVDGVVPTLVVGLGGIWTEALADVVTVPLPVTPGAVREALGRLRGATLLTGGRGRPVADAVALATLAARVGDLLLAEPRLRSVELNPVLAGPAGAVAVDVLALWTDAEPPT